MAAPHSSLKNRPLRPALATRHVVAGAAAGLPRPGHVPRIRELGGIPERALRFRPLHLTLLFARDFRRFAPRLLPWPAFLVPQLPAVFAGAVHPLDTGTVPLHLLLLSRGLL